MGLFLDGPRGGHVGDTGVVVAAAAFLLIDDGLAEFDALAADVDVARSLDQRPHVAMTAAAERTVGVAVAVGRPGRPPAVRVSRSHGLSLVANSSQRMISSVK